MSGVDYSEYQLLANYLGEYVNSDPFPAMIKATDVNASILANDGKVFSIDICLEADFKAGHVNGAVNV